MSTLGNGRRREYVAGGAEDDSPFLSMADFFSLISMTLIYVAVVLGPRSAIPEDAVTVVSGRVAGTEQTAAADPRFAYVSILPAPDGVRVQVFRPDPYQLEDTEVSLREMDARRVSSWVDSVLRTGTSPQRVVFFLDAEEDRPEVHRLLHELVRFSQRSHAVSMVFLEGHEQQP